MIKWIHDILFGDWFVIFGTNLFNLYNFEDLNGGSLVLNLYNFVQSIDFNFSVTVYKWSDLVLVEPGPFYLLVHVYFFLFIRIWSSLA
jgi:hypothetical protein